MIKYYDTEAAYAADAKSSFESQISLVGESNEAKFDGRNVIVGIKSALTGAIAVLDGNSALHFVMPGTFNSGSFMSNYTVVGVVAIGIDHEDFRGSIAILRKNFSSKVWSYIYSFRLTGYTLDGTDRTGVLSVREASNSWAAGVDYTVAYNASTVDALVAQLNTFFRNTTNPVFQTQDWVAVKNGDAIDLMFHYTDYRQASNTGKTGFTLAANLLPEITASSAMLRMNGSRSGEGTITNRDRALAYFSQDLSSTNYNPASDVTTPVRSYPICKPGYLGTSQYQSDHCAALRAIYGEGEEGWKKFMASFLPVQPTKYGVVGDKDTYGDAKTNTYLMAGKKFTGQDGVERVAFPAADECASTTFSHSLMGKGAWVLPDMDLVFSIMKTIKYGTSASRDADPINKALNAIGGSALSNGSGVWSSSRCNANYAWCSLGSYGYAYNYGMYGSHLALPLLLLDVREATL
ncbi:MAG: hypothetical protein II841_04935 [Bacteroidales bacterium]|nr:hypothetical protein [Bacteroidales bacterium]